MIGIDGNHLPEIIFENGNGITAYFDMQYCYNEIPAGSWGVEGVRDYTDGLKLVGPKHGMKDNYGNGSLWVPACHIPDWLWKQLGIKPERRRGERRGSKNKT